MNTGNPGREGNPRRRRRKAAVLLLAAAMAFQGCAGVRTEQDSLAGKPAALVENAGQVREEAAGTESGPGEVEKNVKADETEELLKKVLRAMDERDSEGLKVLFSEYALQNTPGLGQQIQELLDVYQGPSTGFKPSSSIREWHSAFGQEAGGSSLDHGFEYYKAAYTVSTGSGDYKLRMIYYTYNEENPSLNGLFLLEAAEMERYNESDFQFSDGETPGVYYYGREEGNTEKPGVSL